VLFACPRYTPSYYGDLRGISCLLMWCSKIHHHIVVLQNMMVVLKVKLLRTQFTNLSQVGVGFALTRTFQEHVYLFVLFFYVFIFFIKMDCFFLLLGSLICGFFLFFDFRVSFFSLFFVEYWIFVSMGEMNWYFRSLNRDGSSRVVSLPNLKPKFLPSCFTQT